MVTETPYVRAEGYARRYRDQRFTSGTGPRTHRREVAIIRRLISRSGATGGTWLDLPSGAGRLTHLLPGEAWQLDRNPEMLQVCERRSRQVCASSLAVPFADGAFDGALCMRLMQHLPTSAERVGCLAELRRVTRGPVIVSHFHTVSAQHLRRRIRRRLGRPSRRVATSGRQFRSELADAGLRFDSAIPLLRFLSEEWVVLAWAD